MLYRKSACVTKAFFLPCQPSDEAAGISANEEFSNLVQTARRDERNLLCQKTRTRRRDVSLLTQSMPRRMS